MPRQRPTVRVVGAVACLVALAGCGPAPVQVASPAPRGADAAACRHLVAALPDSVSDQDRREVADGVRYAAAWGDPAIVLTCGVPTPEGLDAFSTCQVTNGVGWYIPEEQITGSPREITMTTVGRAQNVRVRIPADYFPPAATMVDLASAIKETIREVRPCV